MEISKEEKEVMGNITDELWTFYDSIKSWLQNESASPEQQLAYTEDNIYVRSNAIHKIYKPLLEDLKAENDRLKEGYEKDTKLIYHADDVIPKLETKIATLKELVEDRTKDIIFYDEENKELKTEVKKLKKKLKISNTSSSYIIEH